MSLEAWGWDKDWALRLEDVAGDSRVARVTGQDRARWLIQTSDGPGVARFASAKRAARLPVTGDWVVVAPGPEPTDPWSLAAVLPRRTAIIRAASGDGGAAQVLAANVDRVWLVHGLDRPPNRRRLERYLAVAWESGAVPEILFTKSDAAIDVTEARAVAAAVGVGVRLWVVSSATDDGIGDLRSSLAPGETIVLLGPSGVGKSSLVNVLADADLAATGEVRPGDRKGRHTTTRRELFRLSGGALLLDTPGIRELGVMDLGDGLAEAFGDIASLAVACRFRDCSHEREPGCAVLAAVDESRLDPERLASYRKLRAEAAYQARKSDPRARAAAEAEVRQAIASLKRHHPKYGTN